MKKIITAYLADLIILIGVILYLQPIKIIKAYCVFGKCHPWELRIKFDYIGIIIVLIGIDILIRRFISLRNNKK